MSFFPYLSALNLNIALVITYLVLMIVFLIMLQIYKQKYLMIFSIAYFIKMVALVLLSFRGLIPVFFTVLLGNILIVGSEFLFIYGIFILLKLKSKIMPFIVLITIFTISHTYYTYFEPSVSIRVTNFSVMMMILSFYFLIRSVNTLRSKFEITILFIGLTYLAFIPYHILRIINALGYEEITNLFRGSYILKGYIFLSVIIAIIRAGSIVTFHTKKLIE